MERMQASENLKKHGSRTCILSSESVPKINVLHHSRVPTIEEIFEENVKMWHVPSFEEIYEEKKKNGRTKRDQ